MSQLSYLVYTSTATEPFNNEQLFDLLSKSRAANEKRGVTGALIYKNDVFVQMLEGGEAEIEALREKIYRNPRHTGVMTLIRGVAKERVFGEWTMHFIAANERDAKAREANYRCLRGHDDIEDMVESQTSVAASPDAQELHPGLRLLLTFRQVM